MAGCLLLTRSVMGQPEIPQRSRALSGVLFFGFSHGEVLSATSRVQNDSDQPKDLPAACADGGGSYVHIRRAVSHTLSSLRLSSSMERPFPTIEEAKPHCELSANRSSGKKRFACVMRRTRSSGASICSRLVLINPRTTILSSGTCRSGANEPDRSSSYSRRSRVALVRWKIGRAIGS